MFALDLRTLAKTIGVHEDTLSAYRNGHKTPGIDMMIRLDEVLHWDVGLQARAFRDGIWKDQFREVTNAFIRKGRSVYGRSKLTKPQVRGIRTLIMLGRSNESIADLYGVSSRTISDIKHNRTWKEEE